MSQTSSPEKMIDMLLLVAAADFVLSLTVALIRKDAPSKKQTSSFVSSKIQPSKLSQAATKDKNDNAIIRETSEVSSELDLKLLLWNSANELINLVKNLHIHLCEDWSQKSRYLHAEGLKRVYTWLQELKQQCDRFQEEAVTSGEDRFFASLFFSILKELLDQYLSGIKFYADSQDEEPDTGKSSKLETVNFFLNCLMLLLGRLDSQQFENTIAESWTQISEILISQLRCADEDVIDGAIIILKAVILKTNHTLSRPGEVLERCSNGKCLNEILKRIYSKNGVQRRNALDVVADLIQITSGSVDALSEVEWWVC
ncbi:hypothetical protein OROHE_012895 [Orobanche hederae]